MAGSGHLVRRCCRTGPVDAWLDDGIISRNDLGEAQEILNSRYQNFTERMARYPFVKIYKEYTFNAVRHFNDNFFDLIYIDADHTYEGCKKDLNDWFSKVKPGGFFTGDDYRIASSPRMGVKFGVIEAVNEFSKSHNLDVYELPRYGWAIIK